MEHTHTHNGMHTGLGTRDGRKVVFSKRGMPVERWAPVLRAFSCRLAENVPHSDGPACGKVFKQICIQIKRWIKVDLHFQGARCTEGEDPKVGLGSKEDHFRMGFAGRRTNLQRTPNSTTRSERERERNVKGNQIGTKVKEEKTKHRIKKKKNNQTR